VTIHEVANDPSKRKRVCSVARAQMKRRRDDYHALAIFEWEDLSQEIWADMTEMYNNGLHLSVFCAEDDDLKAFCTTIAEKIGKRGSRKRNGCVEIPFSDLDPKEKKELLRSMK
jgi:hypothetical protein